MERSFVSVGAAMLARHLGLSDVVNCEIRAELSPSRRSKLLIERGRPLKRRTRLETRDVVDEFRPLGQEIEHHAPAEVEPITTSAAVNCSPIR